MSEKNGPFREDLEGFYRDQMKEMKLNINQKIVEQIQENVVNATRAPLINKISEKDEQAEALWTLLSGEKYVSRPQKLLLRDFVFWKSLIKKVTTKIRNQNETLLGYLNTLTTLGENFYGHYALNLEMRNTMKEWKGDWKNKESQIRWRISTLKAPDLDFELIAYACEGRSDALGIDDLQETVQENQNYLRMIDEALNLIKRILNGAVINKSIRERPDPKGYFQILGIDADKFVKMSAAEQDVLIRSKQRQLLGRYHPDKMKDGGQQAKKINEAALILKTPADLARYLLLCKMS